jgi:hypothetical protein
MAKFDGRRTMLNTIEIVESTRLMGCFGAADSHLVEIGYAVRIQLVTG